MKSYLFIQKPHLNRCKHSVVKSIYFSKSCSVDDLEQMCKNFPDGLLCGSCQQQLAVVVKEESKFSGSLDGPWDSHQEPAYPAA